MKILYIALLTYKVSLEKVDEFLEEHKLYLDKNYNLGNFIFSGKRNPRVGGVILINQYSKNHVMNIIKEDPFYKYDIANYELIEFIPTKYDENFRVFIN
jgi:uncharacterized protein YciI